MSLHVSLAQQDLCYNCGYLETHTGERVEIPSQDEHIPFCGNDTINPNTTEKVPVGMVSV